MLARGDRLKVKWIPTIFDFAAMVDMDMYIYRDLRDKRIEHIAVHMDRSLIAIGGRLCPHNPISLPVTVSRPAPAARHGIDDDISGNLRMGVHGESRAVSAEEIGIDW
jgi:hypothetical protein